MLLSLKERWWGRRLIGGPKDDLVGEVLGENDVFVVKKREKEEKEV